MARAKTTIWFTAYLLATSLLVLIAMEFAVRALFPHINYQGVQQSLFVEGKFNQTMGLASNSSGEIFGKDIRTDEHGFRQMVQPDNYENSWLLLGDSVTFGVGIDTKLIFPQLIQNEFQRIKIWNTAIVGYSTLDYLNVVDVMLRKHNDIKKVVLSFCLNDVYGNLSLNPTKNSMKEKLFSFLRSNSKLYLLIKKSFFDRSKAHALYDLGLYKDGNSDIDKHLSALTSIKSQLDESGIDFLVVILPYEYQLRVGELKAPQDLLSSFFAKHNIESIDLYGEFTELNSEAYFLYGDPMHLSPLGHKVVAKKMVEILQ